MPGRPAPLSWTATRRSPPTWGHADLDLALTVAERVGDRFADDEFAEFGVLAKTHFE